MGQIEKGVNILARGWLEPRISPDGGTLAFVRQPRPGTCDIYLLSLDPQLAPKGQPKRLTFENDYIVNPLWTNDGRELLYTAGFHGTRGVWRVSVRSGASPKQILALAQAGLQVALSRDGKLAYARRYRDHHIWRADLVNGRSSNPAPLIASTFSDSEPRYSPDGKRIAFQSNRSGSSEIWLSNADGTGAVQLTFLQAQAGSPAWSPDGSQIAFDARVRESVDVYVVTVADKTLRRVTSGPGFHITPAWSHDHNWIYFASERTGRLEIWKMPSTGGNAVQVTRSGGFFVFESPDQKFLFYAKNGDNPTTLWRKSLETGKEELFIEGLRYWSYFTVFEDGIYFVPARTANAKLETFEVAFHDLATRRDRTVAEIDKSPGTGFCVGPDRKSVLFAPNEMHGTDLMVIEKFR